VDWLRATHKYLLSFLKSDWQLEDYPVRVVSQEASTDGCCVASPVAGLVAVKMAEAVCRWSPTWEGGVFRSGASL